VLGSSDNNREARLLVAIGVALVSFTIMQIVCAAEDNQPMIFMLLGMLAALSFRIFGPSNGAATRMHPIAGETVDDV
jgi:hypothetical protein